MLNDIFSNGLFPRSEHESNCFVFACAECETALRSYGSFTLRESGFLSLNFDRLQLRI